MRESGDAVSARLTSYHFSKPVFISWQFREPKEYSASAVAKILAESTLLVDAKRIPKPSKEYEIEPPRRLKLGLRAKRVFRFSFPYNAARRVAFLFHLVLPEFSLSDESSISPSGFVRRFHQNRETLTWVGENGEIHCSLAFLPSNPRNFNKEGKEEKHVGRRETAKKAYSEAKDWLTIISKLPLHGN